MRIEIDGGLNFKVQEGGREALIFEPDVNWTEFSEPNIIDGY